MPERPRVIPRAETVRAAENELALFLVEWHRRHELTFNEFVAIVSGKLASWAHYEIRDERAVKEVADGMREAIDQPYTGDPNVNPKERMAQMDRELEEGPGREDETPPQRPSMMTPATKCRGLMTKEQENFCKQQKVPLSECCERAGEYNGYGSDGPLKFICPKSCSCHD